MTPEAFCYWLQGYFEVDSVEYSCTELSPAQIECIKDHLKLVFEKKTPHYDDYRPVMKLGEIEPFPPTGVPTNPLLDYVSEVSC